MATKKAKKVVKSAPKTSVKPKATKTKVAKSTKVVKSVPRASKTIIIRDFAIVKETTPFLTFKITKQTLYWAVFVTYILFLTLWILKLQIDALDLINQINTL